jgi:small subunit ribosomal protein S7
MGNKYEFRSPTTYNFAFQKFVRFLMFRGKKSIADKILRTSIQHSCKSLGLTDHSAFFLQAVFNAAPDIEIKAKKIGTNSYLVPKPISSEHRINWGIKLILEASRSRKESGMRERLTFELIDAFNNKGLAIKKKDEIHKLAELNKSFSHFNW